MKLSKIMVASVAVLAAVGVLAGTFSACKKDEQPQSDSAYLTKVNGLPQTFRLMKNTIPTANRTARGLPPRCFKQ